MENILSLKNLLLNIETFPVMGEVLNSENAKLMDFSPKNKDLLHVNLSRTDEFDAYVSSVLVKDNCHYGIGGYFEHRMIYQRSSVFATQEADFRNIHMGVDIWAPAWAPVFAPLDGMVHSFQDNAGFGNYGPTIILEHQVEGHSLFSLYGHLALHDLDDLKVGANIQAGQKFCHLGPFPENGDWPPHLHFQLMWDLMGNWGDFPGVCSHRDRETYASICPDPNLLIPYLPR